MEFEFRDSQHPISPIGPEKLRLRKCCLKSWYFLEGLQEVETHDLEPALYLSESNRGEDLQGHLASWAPKAASICHCRCKREKGAAFLSSACVTPSPLGKDDGEVSVCQLLSLQKLAEVRSCPPAVSAVYSADLLDLC